MYRVLDVPLLRASAQPADVELPAWPDLSGDVHPNLLRDWLSAIWAREPIADAIAVASPDLARQVERICAGHLLQPRQLRRATQSVGRYLLRMNGRCAPFGLFAGIAPAAFGAEPSVRWGAHHRTASRPDANWLARVITDLEGCPPLLRRLPVIVNDLAEVRDGRVVLPFQHRTDDDGRQGSAPITVDISVRHTAAISAVMTYAQSPIAVGDLLDKVRYDFRNASARAVEAAVGNLVRLRILLTALRPPMTTTDGLAHVLDRLAAIRTDDVPEIADTLGELRAFAEHAECDRRTSDAQSINIDLRLDVDVVLPKSLIQHASATASALTRLAPHQHGLPAWIEYHSAFLERYGVGAVVPLLDLVNSDIGLGYPATYRGSERTVTAQALSERDRGLLRMAQTATMGGGDELVLDDRAIADLTAGDGVPASVPPHVELFLQIHADSETALSQDRYTLAVTGASRAAGATTGRFLHLLSDDEQRRFRTAYSTVATVRAGAVPVQVSLPPLRESSNHLACAPTMLPTVLSAGEFVESDEAIRVEDLGVGGNTAGLFFVSLRDRRLIEPTVLNAVEFRYFSHPLTRFLCELPRARTAVYAPFSWGAAAALPFLPRVRYGRTVLASARWNLARDDLPPAGTAWPLWRDGLAPWRERFRIPNRVYLVEDDNLLPLDLGHDPHLQLLRTHLDRHGHARLDEAPDSDAYGWINGHAHEIVIPLTSTVPPQADSLPPRVHSIDRDAIHLPGSAIWLYAKLYTSTGRATNLLDQVSALMADAELDEWWYLPYHDPDPHLRLRIRLPDPAQYGPAAARISEWAAQLHRDRLISRLQLDTYLPETGRYGHGDAMTAAEHVFAADSAATLAELRAADRGVLLDALTAASVVDLAVAFIGDIKLAMTWLAGTLPNEAGLIPRQTQTAAVLLADPSDDWAAMRIAEHTKDVMSAWQRRRDALAAYRNRLTPQRDPLSVLPSLIHLHSIRIHGTDTDRERLTSRLARAAAQRWSAIHTASTR